MKQENSYSLATETKDILKKYNIKLNKNLGQHFLIDDFKRNKIIEYGELSAKDTVLEIGPGIGTLTLEISKRVKKVISIEKDEKVYSILKDRINENSINNVEIINEDAMKIDFPKFNKIVSNLPYKISSPITFKFLDYKFDIGILMYQKEFARRMTCNIGSKDYSRLSAMLYFKGDVESLINVPSECFIPKPKVDSAIIKLTPNNKLCNNKKLFNNYSKICKALFQHKNKKAENALINSRHEIGYTNKKELKNILNNLNSDELNRLIEKRVITLSPNDILKITKELNEIIINK